MPSRNLPVNIDSAYADDDQDPSRKIHQGHHDVIHAFVDLFDTAAPSNGDALVWSSATGLWIPAAISGGGGPGPAGPTGRGFVFLGDWSAVTTYHAVTVANVYELVRSGGHIFLCLVTNTNSPPNTTPADSTNWRVFARSGADGADGADGTPGIIGPQGPIGLTGAPGPAAESLGSDLILANGATQGFDFGLNSGQVVTINGDVTFSFSDSSGRPYSAFTIVLRMGSGAPNGVTWPAMRWQTVGGAPDLSDMTAGDERDIIIRQVRGVYVGFFPGEGGTPEPPPPDTYPVLAVPDVLTSVSDPLNKTANPAIWSGMGAAIQVGNKKGGTAYVLTTKDNVDPDIPTLQGAGASLWEQVATVTESSAGTTHRRLTEFACRDDIAGAAQQITVTVPNADLGNNTGCMVIVHATAGIVPPSWLTTILATGVIRQRFDSGETSTAPKVTLAAAGDAANRAVACFVDNSPSAVFTPDSPLALIGAELTMSSPTARMRVISRFDAFDTTPSGVFAAAVEWLGVGAEWEQG